MLKYKKRWSDAEIEFLKKNYYELGLKKCAQELGRTLSSVTDKKQKLKLLNKRTKLNIQEFLSPTKRTAYIYGLLWADGSIWYKGNQISLTLINSDAKHLKNLMYDFYHREHQPKNKDGLNRKKQSIFSRISKTLVNEVLIPYNYPNKSFGQPEILKFLDEKLHKYWWLGYSNGDGCFYFNQKHKIRKYSLSSTYEQDWTVLEHKLESLNVKYDIFRRKNNKGHKCSIVEIRGKKNIIPWGEYLYEDYDTIFGYERKYKKYLEMKK